MRLLLDTNVILDYSFTDRDQESLASVMVASAVENKHVCFVPSCIISDYFYIANRYFSTLNFDVSTKVRKQIVWALFDVISEFVEFVGCDESDVFAAKKMRAQNDDMEDNLVIAAAMRCGADYLVTNDKDLLNKQLVPTKTPKQMINILSKKK